MPFMEQEPGGRVQDLLVVAMNLHATGRTISLAVLERNLRTLIGGGALTPGEANMTMPAMRVDEPPRPDTYVAAETGCGDLVLEWDGRNLRYTEFAKANSAAAADRLAHALMITNGE